MGRIGIEETAPVGSELLDSDLRCGRTDRNQLIFLDYLFSDWIALGILDLLARGIKLWRVVLDRLHERHRLVGRESLHYPLSHEQERKHERQRQKDIQRSARDIHPEIAEGFDRLSCKPADHRDQHCHAARR